MLLRRLAGPYTAGFVEPLASAETIITRRSGSETPLRRGFFHDGDHAAFGSRYPHVAAAATKENNDAV